VSGLSSRRLPPAIGPVVIENAQPEIGGGRFFAKAIAGDELHVSADVFSHGHDLVRATVRTRRIGARRWDAAPMKAVGNDHFEGAVVPVAEGPFEIEIAGAIDELASWARDARRRLAADRPDPFEGQEGARHLEQAALDLESVEAREAAATLRQLATRASEEVDLELLDELEELADVLAVRAMPDSATTHRLKAFSSREKAAFSSWYELFPRSASLDPGRPGTLRDVIGRLDYLESLGFDVLYLPPIHPIGKTARKGKGNTPWAEPGDVGSPWAIGSKDGGHTAIAPELGGFADFDELVREARARDIEIAMDLAFQCSPDHPWVKEHPSWFKHRPDGSVACAENPPKRYEDIFPIDFDTEDRRALWDALAGVVSFWADRGVRIFRVDNPHTKPFAFWEWLLAEMKRERPGLLFLSEAFTRPRVMHRLAELGFDQSYTYFTWRDSKWELEQYFKELQSPPGNTYFRPNVWPNTPDILAKSLQKGGRASFISRLVLAAGLSSNYGIYGPVFELGWDEPADVGSEEYKASEKYQVHHHDLEDPASLADVITRVNALRRSNSALQRDHGLFFHRVDNDQLICWSKRSRTGEVVIGVVNLDSRWAQSGFVELDPAALGLEPGERFQVADVLSGSGFHWVAGRNFVKLDPAVMPAHLLDVRTTP
jgi:starch synthase (maltosyl-transferring)